MPRGYATQSAYPSSLILEIAGGVDAVNIAGLGASGPHEA